MTASVVGGIAILAVSAVVITLLLLPVDDEKAGINRRKNRRF